MWKFSLILLIMNEKLSTITKISSALTGEAFPDWCTSSTKPSPAWGPCEPRHIAHLTFIPPISPTTTMTNISVQGDPTLISKQDSRPLLHCPGHMVWCSLQTFTTAVSWCQQPSSVAVFLTYGQECNVKLSRLKFYSFKILTDTLGEQRASLSLINNEQ